MCSVSKTAHADNVEKSVNRFYRRGAKDGFVEVSVGVSSGVHYSTSQYVTPLNY